VIAEVMQKTAEAGAPPGIDRASLFREWRAILEAQRAVEDSRANPIRYSSREVSGRRVIFQTATEVAEGLIGQPRLVRLGRGGVVGGEVEDVSRRSLVLFVERGNPGEVPPAGELIFDSEASRIAIGRQRGALDAVRFGRSLRGDLGALLLSPVSAAAPGIVDSVHFIQPELDDSKKDAVRIALGSPDFAVVQGPPGTGKTTLIAELVAQTLRDNPSARVLVSSQTHVALDNAVERIARLAPDKRLIRVGRPEKNQMDQWRKEVIEKGRAFLRELASARGVTISELDIVSEVERVDAIRHQLRDIRSRIVRREAERRDVERELEELTELGRQVLEVAEQIEAGARGSMPEELRGAAADYMEAGLELAGRLDQAAPLQEKLSGFDEALREWRAELRRLEDDALELRRDLSARFFAGEDQPPGLDELRERLATISVTPDPEFASLLALHREWEERFGQGSEFRRSYAGIGSCGGDLRGLRWGAGSDGCRVQPVCHRRGVKSHSDGSTRTYVTGPTVDARR
jgi:hypothetical protein